MTNPTTVFDRVAREYDADRRRLIPCFDGFYGAVEYLLRTFATEPAYLLDLGAGTGLLSAVALNALPGARMRLVDASAPMLAEAEKRFAGLTDQVAFDVMDYAAGDLGGPYDAVISALSIHHLEADQKAALFRRVHESLAHGGLFINADQVCGPDETIDALYRKNWLNRVQAAGVTDLVLEAAFERMKADRMSTLDDQLTWLKAAGFNETACWFQDFSFVVYGGIKAGTS